MTIPISPQIDKLVTSFEAESFQLDQERIHALNDLSKKINLSLSGSKACRVMFICTHNSRRSQIAELALRLACDYNQTSGIKTYSAGTEVTALNERVIHAFQSLGFETHQITTGDNPKYHISYTADESETQEMFSKVFDDPFNPSERFIAVMVCSDAEKNCPFIPNASHRIKLTYEDPKYADDSEKEAEVYQKKIIEIAREMLYLSNLLTK